MYDLEVDSQYLELGIVTLGVNYTDVDVQVHDTTQLKPLTDGGTGQETQQSRIRLTPRETPMAYSN